MYKRTCLEASNFIDILKFNFQTYFDFFDKDIWY